MTDHSTISWCTQSSSMFGPGTSWACEPRMRRKWAPSSSWETQIWSLCVSRPSSAQPPDCPSGNLHGTSYFWILYFISTPMANVSEVSQCLRTRNLIPCLKGFSQKQVSPYQFTRSVFKANTGPYFIKRLLKNLFFTPSPQATIWNYTTGMPGKGQTPSHTRTARALGWLTFTPQLTSQTVM